MQSSQYHGEKEMYFFLRLEFMFSLSLSHSASPRMKPTDFGQRSTSKLNSETAHTAQIVEYVFLWFKSIWIEIGLKQYGILSLTIELCARALVCVCVCVSACNSFSTENERNSWNHHWSLATLRPHYIHMLLLLPLLLHRHCVSVL